MQDISPDWIKTRQRSLHITMHPIDYPVIDPRQMIRVFQSWRVSLFTFFAAGYTTMYPSELEWQEPSEHLPADRDLVREILEAADQAGIIAVPVIDLGDMPLAVAERHPDWAMQEADGSLRMKAAQYVVSSPCGPYRRDNARELVRELKERYGKLFRGIKWGGASYGFGGGVDHNPHAVRQFKDWSGRDKMPTDTADPDYRAWREQVMADNVSNLTRIAHEEGGVPTIGNSIWNLGEGQHFTALAKGQDLNQLEVQTRTYLIQDDDHEGGWERFSTPIETTRYLTGIAKNPPIVVASYFLAWPWRRVAVPWPEQKVYMAQVVANGGSPMVNMTVGAPAQHADQRGFRAIDELYNLMADNDDCFRDDHPDNRVALVYDHESARAARARGNLHRYYLHEMHGLQEALDCRHVPYDILDSECLEDVAGDRYAALILPAAEKLSGQAVEQVQRLHNAGTALVLDGSTLKSTLAKNLGLGARDDEQPFTRHDEPGPCQAYVRIAEDDHPLLTGMGRPYMAAAGHWYPVDLPAGAQVPGTRAAPFLLFPEGVSYPGEDDPADPLVIGLDREDAGRVAALAFDAGRCYKRVGHPDNARVIANAVRWAARGNVGIVCDGFPDLRISLRRTGFGRAVHLINTTGRLRYMTELTPLQDLRLSLPCKAEPASVALRGSTEKPQWHLHEGQLKIIIPSLTDYAILTIEEHS